MEETQNKIVKRGKSFTSNQDRAICNAWLSITQDPIVGTSQSSNSFWDRVLENYDINANDESSRSRISIQSRWRTIMRSYNKLRGCVSQIESRQQSGLTEADKILQAKLLYCEIEGRKFSFDHCWEILQSSKTYTSTNEIPPKVPDSMVELNSSHGLPEDEALDPSDKRHTRRKSEKESRKKAKASMRFCEIFFEFNKQALKAEKRKARAQERKLEMLEEANERERKKLELEKMKVELKLKLMVEKNEREQKENDDNIMMMDVSTMEPRAKAYHESRKAEICARAARLKHSSMMEDHA